MPGSGDKWIDRYRDRERNLPGQISIPTIDKINIELQ
jgi:hypothetical protein